MKLWACRYNKNVLFVGDYSKKGVKYWAKIINLVHRYSIYHLQSSSSGPSHIVTKYRTTRWVGNITCTEMRMLIHNNIRKT